MSERPIDEMLARISLQYDGHPTNEQIGLFFGTALQAVAGANIMAQQLQEVSSLMRETIEKVDMIQSELPDEDTRLTDIKVMALDVIERFKPPITEESDDDD